MDSEPFFAKAVELDRHCAEEPSPVRSPPYLPCSMSSTPAAQIMMCDPPSYSSVTLLQFAAQQSSLLPEGPWYAGAGGTRPGQDGYGKHWDQGVAP